MAKRIDLRADYEENIRSWDWAAIKADCLANSEEICGILTGYCWLGSVYLLTPSGKVYTFWTTNQTWRDVVKDSLWWEILEEIADEHGMSIGYPECGDGDGVYVGLCIGEAEESEA